MTLYTTLSQPGNSSLADPYNILSYLCFSLLEGQVEPAEGPGPLAAPPHDRPSEACRRRRQEEAEAMQE